MTAALDAIMSTTTNYYRDLDRRRVREARYDRVKHLPQLLTLDSFHLSKLRHDFCFVQAVGPYNRRSVIRDLGRRINMQIKARRPKAHLGWARSPEYDHQRLLALRVALYGELILARRNA